MESRSLAEVAALSRMAEIGGRMTMQRATATEPEREPKSVARQMWALGDYHRFAKATVWEIGPVLVEACGISAGQRVLDVAAGTGNVAVRAAETGASVVASDLTPENFDAGRAEAEARGVELEWIEADAEALPFDDDGFDVVTSSFGAIFAPDHQAVADELVRVCRPGGRIGMANFTPDGLAGDFFETLGRYAPPPPAGSLPPVAWGTEDHVRKLFGERVDELELTRREYVERATSPHAYLELFNATFGPIIAIRSSLAQQPDRLAALERDIADFATRANRGAADGPAEYPYEYLLVVARKAALPDS